MDIWTAILLIAFGLLFLSLEVFVFPGFGISGIIGLISLGAGIFIAFQIDTTVGIYTLGGTLVGTSILIYLSIRFDALSKMTLTRSIDSQVSVNKDHELKAGDTGKTVSRIAPMGKALFGNEYIEVTAWKGFIDEKQPVKIENITNETVYVSQIK